MFSLSLYCLKCVFSFLFFLFFSFFPFNRFFDMVNSITEEIGKTTEEGECDGDSLEVFLLPPPPAYEEFWASSMAFH